MNAILLMLFLMYRMFRNAFAKRQGFFNRLIYAGMGCALVGPLLFFCSYFSDYLQDNKSYNEEQHEIINEQNSNQE